MFVMVFPDRRRSRSSWSSARHARPRYGESMLLELVNGCAIYLILFITFLNPNFFRVSVLQYDVSNIKLGQGKIIREIN